MDLTELVDAQRGALSLAQLAAGGVPRSTVSRRVQSGRWERAFRGTVLCPPYADRSDARRAAAALSAGGVVAGPSAARWWRLDAAPPETAYDVLVPHARHPQQQPGVRVRRTRAPLPDGLVCDPARVIVDLAREARDGRLRLLAGDAIRRGLATGADIVRVAEEVATRAVLARVLAATRDVLGACESALEQQFYDAVVAAGLPPPVPQYLIEDGLGWYCHLDAAWPRERVGAQVDGLRWHNTAAAFGADRRLDRRLAVLGWTVVRVTAADLTPCSRQVVAELAALLDARRERAPREMVAGRYAGRVNSARSRRLSGSAGSG